MNYYYDFSGQKFGYPLSLSINSFERQVFSRQSSLEFSYVLKGAYEVVTERFSQELGEGELVIIAPEDIHMIRGTGEGEHAILTLHIDFSCFPPAMVGNARETICSRLCTREEQTGLLRELEGKIGELLLALFREEKSLFRMNRRMMELVELAAEQQEDIEGLPLRSEQQENYMKAIRYIDENYRRELRLSDVAEKLSFSVPYTSRLFRKYTGLPFVRYLAEVRVRASLEALLAGTDSIEKIAAECGMPSSKAYTTAFREMYGIVPSAYRKQFRKNLRYGEAQMTQEMKLGEEQRELLAPLLERGKQESQEVKSGGEKREGARLSGRFQEEREVPESQAAEHQKERKEPEKVLYEDGTLRLIRSGDAVICRVQDGAGCRSELWQEDGELVLRIRRTEQPG